ncbi:MAG: helix-turn-helix transcriptional regulator [Candidatus Methylomirabilales bacterium]
MRDRVKRKILLAGEFSSILRSMREACLRARKAKGWTQQALAKMLGISGVYLVEIEKGRKVPSVALAERMAKALGLEREAMIRWATEARLTGSARSLYRELTAVTKDPKIKEAVKLLSKLPAGKKEQALGWLRKLAKGS